MPNNARLTPYVVVSWILAAFGALMLGYTVGVSGGVITMDDFLKKFYPAIYERKVGGYGDNYCRYNDQLLQLFTSSLFIAAIVASFGASKACSVFGRRPTIKFASLIFIVAAIVSGIAPNKLVLILGRVLFGIGVAFSNESVPLFLSEVAPPRHKGAVNILYQFFITIGILIANVVNYAVSNTHPFGWRLALGLAGFPSLVLFFGSNNVIMETPSSLIQRGFEKEARETLQKIRGVDNIDNEFQQIKLACEKATKGDRRYSGLFTRASVPPLTVSVLIQVFQQMAGINVVMFYSPVLFQIMGFSNHGLLLTVVVIGILNVLSTVVAMAVLEKFGRRTLLLAACIQMLLCLIGVGAILQVHLKTTGTVSRGLGFGVVVLISLYVTSFAWSWGPLGWQIPSEIFPLETRTAGFMFAICTNMLVSFVVGHTFLSMLCHMRATIFFFFAVWIVLMGLFVMVLLPETRGVPVDDMAERIWRNHPVWNRFMPRETSGAEMT